MCKKVYKDKCSLTDLLYILSSSIIGWYGVLGSVIFCLTGLFASISPILSSFHLTRPLQCENKGKTHSIEIHQFTSEEQVSHYDIQYKMIWSIQLSIKWKKNSFPKSNKQTNINQTASITSFWQMEELFKHQKYAKLSSSGLVNWQKIISLCVSPWGPKANYERKIKRKKRNDEGKNQWRMPEQL